MQQQIGVCSCQVVARGATTGGTQEGLVLGVGQLCDVGAVHGVIPSTAAMPCPAALSIKFRAASWSMSLCIPQLQHAKSIYKRVCFFSNMKKKCDTGRLEHLPGNICVTWMEIGSGESHSYISVESTQIWCLAARSYLRSWCLDWSGPPCIEELSWEPPVGKQVQSFLFSWSRGQNVSPVAYMSGEHPSAWSTCVSIQTFFLFLIYVYVWGLYTYTYL